jgi:carbon-monoxide dehydrogenase large subunit
MNAVAGIGAPVRRREDLRLLTGNGHYSDDLTLPGQLRAVMLRSPHAHADIIGIDTTTAKLVPGVVAVFTADDLLADGVQPIPPDYVFMGAAANARDFPDPVLLNRDGTEMFASPYLPIATRRARFVGDIVAMVVAATLQAAKDGAEAIVVEYRPRAAVTRTAEAIKPEAPRIWDDAPSNIMLDAELGDGAAVDAVFAAAAHVVAFDTWIPRITGVPMEARTAVGVHDPGTGRVTLYAGSGGVVRQKREIAMILGLEISQVRVVARDIGGNFGTKNSIFPEFPLVVWAARKLGHPVKWTCERGEAFLSDYQGRDLLAHAELALDEAGTFLALRARHISNVGAYAASIIPLRKGIGIASGVYRIPRAHLRGFAVLSNTPPTIPYRSAGRPESMFIIERLVDLAARATGIDRIELRRRNLIQPGDLPYRNPVGVTYDNGDYPGAMKSAQTLADWPGYPARLAASQANGKLRGIGLANYIELTMGNPREWSRVTAFPDGTAEVVVGTLASGQGHETSFCQCVSEWLGIPWDRVRLVQGDTDIVPVGGGSHSGRSMRMAGYTMGRAADGVIARGRAIAARLLHSAEGDVMFADGAYKFGTQSVSLAEVARAAHTLNDLPDNLRGPLSAECDHVFKDGGYPYGCAVAEVEIDPETGKVDLLGYAAVDDVGRAINPMILHGQTHGGIAQGVGQALWELCASDPASGQALSGSFMDYAMPRADLLPRFATALSEIPSPSNPLGVRAGGEGGTTPALAAVINAVSDALRPYGIDHVDMPATSEKIWRLIQAAGETTCMQSATETPA